MNELIEKFKNKKLRIEVKIPNPVERKTLMQELGEILQTKWRSGTELGDYTPDDCFLCWDKGARGNIAYSIRYHDTYEYIPIENFITANSINITSEDIEKLWQEMNDNA